MPKGQFYALAIFVMVRLDTNGVGLKLWGRRRACSQDYPIALDPLLLGEHKHDHDFLFSFPFENAKAIRVHRQQVVKIIHIIPSIVPPLYNIDFQWVTNTCHFAF